MYDKQIRYVMAVAREGSFSRAADILDIAQPSLSQYIKKIEKQLGVELFDRSGSNVRLTDAGQVYLDSGRQILEIERQMESRFQDISLSRYGTIRIGIAAHRSVCLMPRIVKAFREEYPNVMVILDERPRGELMDAAEYGEFDLCVTTLPVDEKLYEIEALFQEELLLAVPKASALYDKLKTREAEGKIDFTLVNGSDFAMLNEDHLMQHQLELLMAQYGLHLNKTVECTSLEALLAMVNAGVGAAIIPACLCNFISENIAYFRLQQETAKRDIVVIHKKDRILSKAAAAFKDYMKRMLR